MLSRINRLSLREDRVRLEKEGATRHSALFVVISAPSPTISRSTAVLSPESHSGSRFVILISKKLAPLSVTRHLLRRRITEVIRHNLDKFPVGRDFLLIPKKSILTATPDQILSDLTSSLRV